MNGVLYKVLLLTGLFASLSLGSWAQAPSEAPEPQTQRVGWARLKVPGPQNLWRRHAEADPALTRFLHSETTVHIDRAWYEADVASLQDMCLYPLLFAQSIASVTEPASKDNLAEYLRRGGFLFVDQCCNRGFNPDDSAFLAAQESLLTGILPQARVMLLPEDHPVYHCFFQIEGGPPHTYYEGVFDRERSERGLYGITLDNGKTLSGIITLSGLQCGWAGMIAPPGHDVECMKMAINIYIYAMLQTGK